MPNSCPWCGKTLEKKNIVEGDSIKEVCSKCGFKLKEYKKPVEPVKQEEPKVVEIREEEKPKVREKPIWPWIIGALVLILLIIVLVKGFLLK